MERPEAWTPIERYNIEQHGPGPMLRVGVFQAAELIAGAAFIVAWGPRKGTTGPGFCVAPHMSMGQPFPYDSDTKDLPPDITALFMTVWRPSTRSAENSCGIRQG